MTTSIHSYLTFAGNCREAMTFYQSCLGGELNFQTIGASPLSEKMPEKMKGYILNATLTNGLIRIMATDIVGNEGLVKGNAVALLLNCSTEAEVRSCYERLAAGGTATHPLENNLWGALFGDLKDKYGNYWLLHFDKNQQ